MWEHPRHHRSKNLAGVTRRRDLSGWECHGNVSFEIFKCKNILVISISTCINVTAPDARAHIAESLHKNKIDRAANQSKSLRNL